MAYRPRDSLPALRHSTQVVIESETRRQRGAEKKADRVSVLHGSEFCCGGGEDFGVGVDVGLGGGGVHEGHVVEGRQEVAANQGVEVEAAFEFAVGGGGGFAAIVRRLGGEG